MNSRLPRRTELSSTRGQNSRLPKSEVLGGTELSSTYEFQTTELSSTTELSTTRGVQNSRLPLNSRLPAILEGTELLYTLDFSCRLCLVWLDLVKLG